MVWGDLGCYKHFLPRIFELVLTAGALETPNPELVFGILRYGKWRTWSEQEQKLSSECLKQCGTPFALILP